ncbi:MAG: glycerol-3-phosphate 1-O-acyltransferase PlsY [Kiritimatiellia bacterium]
MTISYALLLFSAYLLGSIPFGLLISRTQGVDIRRLGSGNIGATNVFRMVGKKWGLLCFLLDFLKGLVSAWIFPRLLLPVPDPNLCLLAGAFAILGHNFPVWLRFRGGKGIATSAGVIVAVAPWCMLCAALTWGLCMGISRIVSLSSILAALAVGISAWIFYADQPLLAGILSALAAVAILRHRSNIQRLLKGEEHRFGKSKT